MRGPVAGTASSCAGASVRIASSAASSSRRSNGRPSRSKRSGELHGSARPSRAATAPRRAGRQNRCISAAAVASASSVVRRRPGRQRSSISALRVGSMREQPDRAVSVPEPKRLRLVHALDVIRELHLDDDLRAVGELRRRNELGIARLERLAELEVPRDRQWAPSATTLSGSTSSSGNRSASSAAHASASSAQTITVGPEPERVAPTAPRGNLARTSSRMREGR